MKVNFSWNGLFSNVSIDVCSSHGRLGLEVSGASWARLLVLLGSRLISKSTPISTPYRWGLSKKNTLYILKSCLSHRSGRHFRTKLMSLYIGAGQNDWFDVRIEELVSTAKNPGGISLFFHVPIMQSLKRLTFSLHDFI